MMQRRLTKADAGGVFEVTVGEYVTVELPENPTTGYRWQLEGDPGIIILSSTFVAGTTAIGAGGIRQFVLCANLPGEFGVRAKLWRTWSGEGSALERFAIAIRAR